MTIQTIKAIVVDDEPDVRLLFEMHFSEEIKKGHFDFHFELSAEGVLNYLSNREADDVVLILSDINMPGMNGLDLLKSIKERYTHLLVFLITAYGDADTQDRARQLCCDDFFTKPLDFEELKEKILQVN